MLNDDVKHLTCYYWKYQGGCMHPDDRCLYAHFDTGKDAEEPKRKITGGPPIAGKNAKSSSPVYNNWRDIKMKVTPEPEEPAPRVDVPLFVFVKARGSKKPSASKVKPSSDVLAKDTLKPTQADAPSDTISQVAAPKSWSQVATSKPNTPSKPSIPEPQKLKGPTSEPFRGQSDKIDLVINDLRLSKVSAGRSGGDCHSTCNGKKNKPLQGKPEGFIEQNARAQRFEERARYAEVMRLMKDSPQSSQFAVTDTFISLNLRFLKPGFVPPKVQNLCLSRHKTKQKLLALTLWVKLFREDCAKLSHQDYPIAKDYAAWGSLRVKNVEKIDGPNLRARLITLDNDITFRVRQLPARTFL